MEAATLKVAEEAGARAEFVRDVVEAATSMYEVDEYWRCAVRCVSEHDGRRCGAQVEVMTPQDDIHSMQWRCLSCGDDGAVTALDATNHDLSMYVPPEDFLQWRLDEDERALLWRQTAQLPELRAVIVRASPLPDEPSIYRVPAALEELDEIYTLIEELSDVLSNRRDKDLLDGIRESLCVTMDGF